MFMYNERMGLQMTENLNENLFCVESDGSTSLDFRSQVDSEYDTSILYDLFQETEAVYRDEDSERTRSYLAGDLIETGSLIESQFMKVPQLNSFGRCDSHAHIRFGENVEGECRMKFEEL